MKSIRILLLTVLGLLCTQSVWSQGYSFTNYYAPKQARTGSNIWDIYQGSNGLMYFASTTGVVIHDGINWIPIHIEEKGRGLDILEISADTLLVTGQNGTGYLVSDSTNNPIYTSLNTSTNAGEQSLVFTKIHRLQKQVFLTGSGGLYALQNDQLVKIDEINSYVITSFKVGDELILSTPDGLWAYDGSDAIQISGSDQLANTPILASAVINSTQAFLFSYNGDSFFLDDLTVKKIDTDLDSDTQVWDAISISDNLLAIATRNKGVIFLDHDLTTHSVFNESNGLATNRVNTLYLDEESVLWIGLGDGIQKLLLNGDAFKYGSEHGIKEPISAFTVNGNHQYAKTRNGVLYRDSSEQQSFSALKSVNHVQNDGATAWYIGSDGIGIMNGRQKQEAIFDDEAVIQIFEEVNESESIHFLTPGRIIEYTGTRFLEHPINSDILNAEWVDGAYFQNKYYLLDRKDGVFVYSDSTLKKVPIAVNSNERVFVNTLEIVDKQLMIGVDVEEGSSGLYQLNEKGVFELANNFKEVDEELISKQVFYIKECSAYEFWVVNNKKVKRVIKVGGVYEVVSDPYTQIGEQESIFDIACDESGVWFGGIEGLYHLPNVNWFNEVRSKTLITNFYASGDSLLYGGFGTPSNQPFILDYSENELRFNFTSTSFVNNTENTFSYKLIGFDANWSAWTKERQKDYTNIPEGNYTFKVKSKNVYNIEGDIAALQIRVLPPWYRTWWAYTAYALLIGLILYLIYRIRVQQILKVQNIRNRIADDLHDDLSGTLIGISNFARAINRFEDEEKKKRFVQLIEKSAGEAKEKISDIVWAINPEHDDWESFVAKCRRYASDLLGANEIEFDLDMDSIIHGKLPMNTRQNLWLVYKEIITNIVRHAKASYVQIAFNIELDTLKIFIRDNGIGFDENKIERGNGLLNIKQRVLRCKGKIKLESELNKGTRWEIEVRLYP